MNLLERYFSRGKQSHTESDLVWPAGEEGSFRLFVRRFRRHKLAVAGLVVLVLMTLCAIFAPLLTPYQPSAITDSFGAAPSMKHLMGTDQVVLGCRDWCDRDLRCDRYDSGLDLGILRRLG